MAPPKKDTPLKSPLVSAFSNIVNINRSKSQIRSTQRSYNEFLKFMTNEVTNLQAIKLPDEKKVKRLSNINVASTFGSAGSLLSALASGALDAAGLVGDLFGGGRGGKGGKGAKKPSPKAGKPIPKGKKIRLPGVRGLPIISAALAGLDFAQGISEGESKGKAGAGALGSAAGAAGGALAGTALAGAIGQALVPIPGLGFVLGAAVGSLGGFAGGYLADRAYEAATGQGNVKEKQKAKLKAQEQKQKEKATAAAKLTLPEVLDKFETVVIKFEKSVSLGAFETSRDTDSEKISTEVMEDDANYGDRDVSPSALEGNIQELEASGGSLPSSKLGSKYGMRFHPIYKVNRMHRGNDYPVSEGTAISVIQPGKVANAGFVNNGYGNQIKIDHPGGISSFYAHLSSIDVKSGQDVTPGTVIGKVGSTGASTGPHLHFEVDVNGKTTDPTPYQDKIFRFGGSVKVKPSTKPQQNMAGQPVATQQPTQENKTQPAAPVAQPSADMQKKYQMAWDNRNNPFARGRIQSAWEDLSPEQQQQAKVWAKSKGYNWDEMKLKEKPATVQAAASNSMVVPVPSMQQVVPEQIQQYPDYNLPQSSVTLMPIIMGGGGGSQQRPMVIAGSGGGGGTTIMPPVPEGQVLNSLFKTILLTNLSGT